MTRNALVRSVPDVRAHGMGRTGDGIGRALGGSGRRRLRSLASVSTAAERAATHGVSRSGHACRRRRELADDRRCPRRADPRTRWVARQRRHRRQERVGERVDHPRNAEVVAPRRVARARRRPTGRSPEGFVLRSTTVGGKRATVIAANSDVGILYGAFDLLRRVQTLQGLSNLAVASAPRTSRCGCSIIGTTSIAASSADTPECRCGIGRTSGFAPRTISRLRARRRGD